MTDERLDLQRLLGLRKLTRAIADLLRDEMRAHLTTLAPLLAPRTVLGDFVQGVPKGAVRGADRVWKELETLHDAIARTPPFDLARDLKPPLEIPGIALEMAPVEYDFVARTEREERRVTVTKPFEWILSYSAHGPARLRELLADRNRDAAELQRAIVLALVLHLVVARQTGVAAILAGLRLPLETRRLPAFGQLPLTVIVAAVPTRRPPDEVVLESTELTGTNTFQEVVDVAAIGALVDPLRARLVELARSHGEQVGSS
jgi:hypothetical protein